MRIIFPLKGPKLLLVIPPRIRKSFKNVYWEMMILILKILERLGGKEASGPCPIIAILKRL
jgi:hypothetical protein